MARKTSSSKKTAKTIVGTYDDFGGNLDSSLYAMIPQLEQAPVDDHTAAVLASIIQEEEHNATSSSVVDHHSQLASWTPPAEAEDQLLEGVLAELESDEPPANEQSNNQPANDQPTWGHLLQSFEDEEVVKTVVAIADQIDARGEFEDAKNPDNGNIHRTIKKVRDQMVTKRAARLLLATSVTPAFIMREVHSGSKYNVYALGKLGDIIKGVTDGVVSNAINIACMKSLFAFRKAEAVFTMECAKGAASKQYAARNIEASLKKHLISHTVSPSTAPTQASSTMQALETIGVVRRIGGGKNPSYVLTEAPIVAKLETMMSAAA